MKWVQLFTDRQCGRGEKRTGFSLYKMICGELLLWVRITGNVHVSGPPHHSLQTVSLSFVLGKNSDFLPFQLYFLRSVFVLEDMCK